MSEIIIEGQSTRKSGLPRGDQNKRGWFCCCLAKRLARFVASRLATVSGDGLRPIFAIRAASVALAWCSGDTFRPRRAALTFPSGEVNRTTNVKMLISLVDYGINARTFRNMLTLKVRPPVLLLLRRDWIYMKNNVVNGLISKCVKIKCVLRRVFGCTIVHGEKILSVIMPRDVHCIAKATLCCIPLLCCGSALIPAKMRKCTRDLVEVAL